MEIRGENGGKTKGNEIHGLFSPIGSRVRGGLQQFSIQWTRPSKPPRIDSKKRGGGTTKERTPKPPAGSNAAWLPCSRLSGLATRGTDPLAKTGQGGGGESPHVTLRIAVARFSQLEKVCTKSHPSENRRDHRRQIIICKKPIHMRVPGCFDEYHGLKRGRETG